MFEGIFSRAVFVEKWLWHLIENPWLLKVLKFEELSVLLSFRSGTSAVFEECAKGQFYGVGYNS